MTKEKPQPLPPEDELRDLSVATELPALTWGRRFSLRHNKGSSAGWKTGCWPLHLPSIAAQPHPAPSLWGAAGAALCPPSLWEQLPPAPVSIPSPPSRARRSEGRTPPRAGTKEVTGAFIPNAPRARARPAPKAPIAANSFRDAAGIQG